MHYDLVTPFGNIFNKIEDLLEYGETENFPYSQPQAISKAYNILNKAGNFESPSSPGIVSLQSRKRGSHSRVIFERPIYNSPIPEN